MNGISGLLQPFLESPYRGNREKFEKFVSHIEIKFRNNEQEVRKAVCSINEIFESFEEEPLKVMREVCNNIYFSRKNILVKQNKKVTQNLWFDSVLDMTKIELRAVDSKLQYFLYLLINAENIALTAIEKEIAQDLIEAELLKKEEQEKQDLAELMADRIREFIGRTMFDEKDLERYEDEVAPISSLTRHVLDNMIENQDPEISKVA